MDHEDLNDLFNCFFKFRARVVVQKEFANYFKSFPNCFHCNIADGNTNLIRENIKNYRTIDIFCLKEYLTRNQIGLPSIEIFVRNGPEDEYKLFYDGKRYVITINLTKFTSIDEKINKFVIDCRVKEKTGNNNLENKKNI